MVEKYYRLFGLEAYGFSGFALLNDEANSAASVPCANVSAQITRRRIRALGAKLVEDRCGKRVTPLTEPVTYRHKKGAVI